MSSTGVGVVEVVGLDYRCLSCESFENEENRMKNMMILSLKIRCFRSDICINAVAERE